ncbi:MAG: hypothetical protein GSR72_03380 [Desulfurococcales archaeon]|nr:hypothetical protein [Desulfurococcales archaeon]MEB3788917.1 hypothetical protein [Desulfurococcales archaeon]
MKCKDTVIVVIYVPLEKSLPIVVQEIKNCKGRILSLNEESRRIVFATTRKSLTGTICRRLIEGLGTARIELSIKCKLSGRRRAEKLINSLKKLGFKKYTGPRRNRYFVGILCSRIVAFEIEVEKSRLRLKPGKYTWGKRIISPPLPSQLELDLDDVDKAYEECLRELAELTKR